jgi:hypothetical protein
MSDILFTNISYLTSSLFPWSVVGVCVRVPVQIHNHVHVHHILERQIFFYVEYHITLILDKSNTSIDFYVDIMSNLILE